ncbi:MAG: class I SAM-dependent methyltransferase [Candidatus Hermodarchaeota archaeon]|nr:class I SAM-dependent methyltransferase [Candidatus Hermodarchaeota archaeon]
MDVWLVVGFGLILFLLVVAGILAYLVWPMLFGAMYQPSTETVVQKMLELAGLTSDDTLYDLGSGDGRILFLAAQQYGAKAVGIEIDPIRYFRTKRKIERHGLEKQIQLIQGNFFDQNLADATVVTIYQSQRTNQKIKTKFLQELRPQTRIVSNRWTFEGWNPSQVDATVPLYLYQMNAL